MPENQEGEVSPGQRVSAGADAYAAGRDMHVHVGGGYGMAEPGWDRLAVLGQHAPFSHLGADREALVSVALPLGWRNGPLRGRDELLAGLAASGPGLVVIFGLGGSGKTRLALEVASQAERHERRVWWVSAAQQAAFEGGMRAVGRQLGVPDADLSGGMAADETWRRLEACPDRWLLVIDQADDPQVLLGADSGGKDGRGWLRPLASPNGRVVVTSREGRKDAWTPWCRLERLGMLAPPAAGEVLADFAGHIEALGSRAEAESLADRLGGFPLALKIAGSSLATAAQTPAGFSAGLLRTYAEFHAAIERGDLTALREADLSEGRTRELIGITGELTLGQLEARPVPHVRNVLLLLAVLADAPVPYELLDADVLARSAMLRSATGPQVWQALTALAECGFADLPEDGEPAAVRLHPLVRDTMRSLLTAREHRQLVSLAARLVARAAPDDPGDPKSWQCWQFISPHAVHVLGALAAQSRASGKDLASAARSAYLAARFFQAQGWLPRAGALLRDVIAVQGRLLGQQHPDTLTSRHSAVRLLVEQGDLASAAAGFREILTARLEALGPDHPDTLVTQFEIAFVMEERGDLANAEDAFRQVLAASSRIHGESHPATLMTKFEVAYTMAVLGRHAEAESMFREVLASRLEALGPDHPDTLTTRHRIAWTKAHAGDYANAEAIFQEVHKDKLRALGPGHPSTLATQYQLARTAGALGDYSRAEATFREVLTGEARVLGLEHPNVMATRYDLARMIGEQGRLTEEQDQQQELLQARLRVLGPDHPETLVSHHRLAVLQAAQGCLAQAEVAFSDVLQARLQVLGPDHPDTLATMHRTAWVQELRGNTTAARVAYSKALAARQRVLGPDHPDTLATKDALQKLG